MDAKVMGCAVYKSDDGLAWKGLIICAIFLRPVFVQKYDSFTKG